MIPSLPSLLQLLSLCFSFLLTAGCVSQGGRLTLETDGGRELHTQRFPQAFIAQDTSGEYDILLVDSGIGPQPGKASADQPLQPAPIEPLRQVMHLHVYWRPLPGTVRNPAATNARIHWYVFGSDEPDLLLYEGAGFVSISGSGDSLSVSIRDGRLTPALQRGAIGDPIGPATIGGRFLARPNASRVRQTLAELPRPSPIVEN